MEKLSMEESSMTGQLNAALQYAHDQKEVFYNKLCALLAIPSVSTDPIHVPDMQAAAQWLTAELSDMGFSKANIFQTEKHPIVFAERMEAGPDAPTVLIYGHYDVQPAEPLELWQTGPFEATQRGDNLFARGSSDMKGQVLATFSAIRAVLSAGPLPVNVKYILEGEEEIGSPSLSRFLQDHKELLASSFALNPDAGMIAADIPTIVYGLRGLAYFELCVHGPAHDLHSGLFGGVVQNPAIVLADLISGMHTADGRITLPGFYDRVQPISHDEHLAMASLPMDQAYYLENTGASMLWGETGYLPAERVGGRPTLDVNGILSGFTGEGSKTVIPAWAMAKLSMRLVPDQDPEEVHRQLLAYLNAKAPKTVHWELTVMAGGPASVTDINQPGTRALARSMQAVWGKAPVFKREGGSIPVVSDMQNILGIDSVLTGFGLPDDNLHAPNEKLHLPTWYRGIDALIHFFYNLAEMN
jgi:acetylornithine deacetylase/succinyl-diaminopimelate desuccinylase-like protein